MYMSTVDCERGFSALSRIKTDIRNRLSSKILNHLMTISVEGPSPEEFPCEEAYVTSGHLGGIAGSMSMFNFHIFGHVNARTMIMHIMFSYNHNNIIQLFISTFCHP